MNKWTVEEVNDIALFGVQLGRYNTHWNELGQPPTCMFGFTVTVVDSNLKFILTIDGEQVTPPLKPGDLHRYLTVIHNTYAVVLRKVINR